MDVIARCAQALKDDYGRLGVLSRVPIRRHPTLGEIAETVLDAADYRGAVEEAERLRAALRWYAIGDHFPHPDYSARAQAALRSTTGGQ